VAAEDEFRDELVEEYDEEQAAREIGPPGTTRIAFARIEGMSLMTTVGDVLPLLQAALVPGTSVDHYGRNWRMGQTRVEGLSLVGRIGFEARNMAEVFDEAVRDFREAVGPAGLTSPFAIDPGKMGLLTFPWVV